MINTSPKSTLPLCWNGNPLSLSSREGERGGGGGGARGRENGVGGEGRREGGLGSRSAAGKTR